MNTSASELATVLAEDEQQQAERFRHVDLSHPLMQVLYKLQLETVAEENNAE